MPAAVAAIAPAAAVLAAAAPKLIYRLILVTPACLAPATAAAANINPTPANVIARD